MSTNLFKRAAREEWTLARIAALSVADIKQLRDNAQRLNEAAVVELCSQALKEARPAPGRARGKAGPRTKARRLTARVSAFQARGVQLEDPRTSWSGVRKSDGAVVVALWADAIESGDGACRYLLWGPNVEGSRPWSDKPAGKERLEHCKRALETGRAEGLLVYGRRQPDYQPEDRAYAIDGVDAETVLALGVEKRGDEFWAVWGKKAAVPSIGPS